ncbi:MAG: hypothetical protein WDO18_12875 [Acidobacteriota bacterium]
MFALGLHAVERSDVAEGVGEVDGKNGPMVEIGEGMNISPPPACACAAQDEVAAVAHHT